MTKKEVERLTKIRVLEKSYDSEWAAPTFIQPKKTGDVRILTDFRRLNAVLKRKMAIDLSMGYYHIPLDDESARLCTTILPWGNYQYRRLPMGIKNSPDIFQSIMNDIFHDLDYVQCYIDDILITSQSNFEDHLEKLQKVLSRLEQTGFRANLRKCAIAQHELEYLGYWLSRNGIQPQPRKWKQYFV
jgi:hypothetical protein